MNDSDEDEYDEPPEMDTDCTCPECVEYCDDCEMDVCECEQYTQTEATPWGRRGISIQTRKGITNWEFYWPEINRITDPIQCAADFYLLEAISNEILVDIRHIKKSNNNDSLTEILSLFDLDATDKQMLLDAKANVSQIDNLLVTLKTFCNKQKEELDKLVNWLDPTLINYMQMVIGGELRHHQAVGKKAKILGGSRTEAWCGWRQIYEKLGNQAILDAAELFREMGSGSIGGPKWAEACDILYARLTNKLGPTEQMNKQIFVDRVWTLEHNGGAFLNKIDWSVLNDYEYNISCIRQVLDAHGAQPINTQLLLSLASSHVKEIYSQYMKIINEIEKTRGTTPTKTYNTNPVRFKKCDECGSNIEKGHLAYCTYPRSMVGPDWHYSKPNEQENCQGYGLVWNNKNEIVINSNHEYLFKIMTTYDSSDHQTLMFKRTVSLNGKTILNLSSQELIQKLIENFGLEQLKTAPIQTVKIQFDISSHHWDSIMLFKKIEGIFALASGKFIGKTLKYNFVKESDDNNHQHYNYM